MMKNEVVIKSLDELDVFARDLSGCLCAGTTLNLTGEIGAGKTALTKFLLKYMGVEEVVKSPTYNIVLKYDGREYCIYHADVYRICEEDELYAIGFEDYFTSDNLVIVEWGDMFIDYIKDCSLNYVELNIEVQSDNSRLIKVIGL